MGPGTRVPALEPTQRPYRPLRPATAEHERGAGAGAGSQPGSAEHHAHSGEGLLSAAAAYAAAAVADGASGSEVAAPTGVANDAAPRTAVLPNAAGDLQAGASSTEVSDEASTPNQARASAALGGGAPVGPQGSDQGSGGCSSASLAVACAGTGDAASVQEVLPVAMSAEGASSDLHAAVNGGSAGSEMPAAMGGGGASSEVPAATSGDGASGSVPAARDGDGAGSEVPAVMGSDAASRKVPNVMGGGNASSGGRRPSDAAAVAAVRRAGRRLQTISKCSNVWGWLVGLVGGEGWPVLARARFRVHAISMLHNA